MNPACSHSLKDLDEALGQPKGHAFRLFKSVLPSLHEGRDFILLQHEKDQTAILQLKQSRRIYQQSVNVILLSDECFEKLRRLSRQQP